MIKQMENGYVVVIRSADELGGFPMTGKRDAAVIEVYDSEEETLIDSAWLTISKNGIARLDRVK
jgi:hypothetical protein